MVYWHKELPHPSVSFSPLMDMLDIQSQVRRQIHLRVHHLGVQSQHAYVLRDPGTAEGQW
jgi:hypothetical protein